MNYRYESDSARQWLDGHLQAAAQFNTGTPLLSTIDIDQCTVTQFDHPPSLWMVKSGEDGTLEEVAVTVPGIICSKVLPPVYGPLRSYDAEHVRRMRQFVRLTGLGSHAFDAMSYSINRASSAFEMITGPDKLDALDFGQYEGQYCVDMHSRHLTERRLAGNEPHIPFEPEIDPNHVLDEARDTRFIRIQDNVVQYSMRRTWEDSSVYYEPLAPVNFKEGDIVEATGAFVAYPLSGGSQSEGGYKLVFCLRALTMLHSQFREDSKIKQKDDNSPKRPDPHARPKRDRIPSSRSVRRHYVPMGGPPM